MFYHNLVLPEGHLYNEGKAGGQALNLAGTPDVTFVDRDEQPITNTQNYLFERHS